MRKKRWGSNLGISCILFLTSLFAVTSCDDAEPFNPLLVSVDVPENYYAGWSGFVLAYDNAGELITFAALTEGGKTDLTSETYKERTFTLAFVTVNEDGSYKDLEGTSYHGMHRGAEVIFEETNDGSWDSFYVAFENLNANVPFYRISSNGSLEDVTSEYPYRYFYTGGSPSRLFITRYNQNYEPADYQFPTTTFANNTESSFNLSNDTYAPYQTEIVNLPVTGYASVHLYGLPTLGNYTERYEIPQSYDNNDPSHLTVFYPTTFPNYASDSYMGGEEFSYYAYNKSKRSDFDLLSVETNASFSGSSVTYSLAGEANIVSFDFYKDVSGGFISWQLFALKGNDKIVNVPELPGTITNRIPSFNTEAWESYEDIYALKAEGVDSMADLLRATTDGSLDNGMLNYKFHIFYDNTLNNKAKTLNTGKRESVDRQPRFTSLRNSLAKMQRQEGK